MQQCTRPCLGPRRVGSERFQHACLATLGRIFLNRVQHGQLGSTPHDVVRHLHLDVYIDGLRRLLRHRANSCNVATQRARRLSYLVQFVQSHAARNEGLLLAGRCQYINGWEDVD